MDEIYVVTIQIKPLLQNFQTILCLFRFYARTVGRKVGEKKKKQTSKRACTDAEQEERKQLAKGDNAFSFGRALLLKVEACYTCALRAFAQGREEVFNTLIKSRLRIVHEVG